MASKFYDGTKLLSLKDLYGNKPEIYLCTTNRSGGKTTFFSRWFVNRYLKYGEKFAILYRFNYELDNCADKFFKDIRRLFFSDHEMTSISRAKGIYHELLLDDICCGYAISINSADQLKKYSHFFSDVERILFDEFQSETGKYCSNEVKKFLSIHTSIARGNGEMVRYVPVIMLSNAVSIINPYYIEMGISERLSVDTKFLRGDGYVLEQGYIEAASQAQKSSGFNRAFSKNKYVDYASQNIYLNDNKAFVEKMEGNNRYLCTLKYMDNYYAIKEYAQEGVLYCDTRVDDGFPIRIAVTTDDHAINYVMLKRNDIVLANLRFFFERGCFRFKDLSCKEAVLKALSYKFN